MAAALLQVGRQVESVKTKHSDAPPKTTKKRVAAKSSTRKAPKAQSKGSKKAPTLAKKAAAKPRRASGKRAKKSPRTSLTSVERVSENIFERSEKKNEVTAKADLQTAENYFIGIVQKLGGVISKPVSFSNFVDGYRNEDHYRDGKLSVTAVVRTLREVAADDAGWLKLPPNERGPVQWKMIRPDVWNCDLLLPNDDRRFTCGTGPESDALNPRKLTCSGDSRCNVEHGNAYRTLVQVGTLPCCPTSPFCAAPACNKDPPEPSASLLDTGVQCTKQRPENNMAYMKRQDTWPAFHGWGGSFELDTLKLIDALSCNAAECPEYSFDLALDLGANTGYYTEKLTVRDFAKNYIMVEANPAFSNDLRSRWEDEPWKQSWFTRQASNTAQRLDRNGFTMPNFLVINQALSNHSTGLLDMCVTEASLALFGGCEVNISSVDRLVDQALTPTFQDYIRDAQSAFIKVDTEGMDELVLRGMQKLLQETRGEYEDGSPKFLVNFLQFEFSPLLMRLAKDREGFQSYDIKTAVDYLEEMGFETFLIGPRFLPMSHGSWHDEFKTFTDDPSNNAGVQLNYPGFTDTVCPWCNTMQEPSFTGDIFAMRASHPRATELKLALGACQESRDFNIQDAEYSFDQELEKPKDIPKIVSSLIAKDIPKIRKDIPEDPQAHPQGLEHLATSRSSLLVQPSAAQQILRR